MLVISILERFLVVPPPCLKVCGAADVPLHLLLPVHLGLHHICLVNDVGHQALALQGAAAILLHRPPRAVAGLLLWWVLHRNGWLDVGQDLPVMGGDDLFHIGQGGVGQL